MKFGAALLLLLAAVASAAPIDLTAVGNWAGAANEGRRTYSSVLVGSSARLPQKGNTTASLAAYKAAVARQSDCVAGRKQAEAARELSVSVRPGSTLAIALNRATFASKVSLWKKDALVECGGASSGGNKVLRVRNPGTAVDPLVAVLRVAGGGGAKAGGAFSVVWSLCSGVSKADGSCSTCGCAPAPAAPAAAAAGDAAAAAAAASPAPPAPPAPADAPPAGASPEKARSCCRRSAAACSAWRCSPG